ncbi:hypothetical protein [Lysobacter xanthus]
MPLRTTLLSVGTFAALATTSIVSGHRAAPVAQPAGVVLPAAAAPLAVDDAVGAAVIESISRQFDTADVLVQLGDVQVRPASIQDREVTGEGRLRIDGAGPWIAFHFDAMYDTASTEVTAPRLVLAGGTAAPVPTRSPLASSLDRQVVRALRDEFQSQPVKWSASDVRGTDLGRYVRVEGHGRVDFGADGSSPAQVQGLYDRETGRWLRLRYELDGEGDAAPTAALASL